jgi:hypothetical protein
MTLPISGTVNDNQAGILRPRKTATPLVINGDMQVAQRGDQTGITAGQYINIDRYFINMINLGTWSFTQSSDTPAGQGFGSSLKIDCTTADASPSAGDNFYLSFQSEGQNLQVLEKGTSDAQTSTLAYWIKCNKTGNYVVELWDRTNDRHVAVLKTISSADTWQKVVCNFPADTSGALANTNARSIMVSWAFDSGTDYTSGTLPSSWASRTDSNRFVGTNLGLGDNTANEVLITGVQWEVGTFDANSIPDFQFEDRATSLARCQRYFESVSGAYLSLLLIRESGYLRAINYPYKVTKRTAPTVTLTSSTTDGVGSLAPGSATVDNVRFSCSGGETSGPRVHDFTMEAEL